ncbi:MAG TPA: outer membrane beta-barrel protein [Ferruginibacter sp.]|nr:outer membrane beta-barrel protein [Ferruginibacter sp.]
MENKFYTDDFEQLLKEKSDQFRMYPSKRVWHSIYNDLHPGRKWPSVAMSMLLIIVLLLVGYLNTGDDTLNRKFTAAADEQAGDAKNNSKKVKNKNRPSSVKGENQQLINAGAEGPAGADNINSAAIADISFLTAADLATGLNNNLAAKHSGVTSVVAKEQPGSNGNAIFQKVDAYIKTNQIFTDIATVNKKKKTRAVAPSNSNNNQDMDEEELVADDPTGSKKIAGELKDADLTVNTLVVLPGLNNAQNAASGSEKSSTKKDLNAKKTLSAAEKSWIENYALLNRPSRRGKWKGRLAIELYTTPAINYRKLNMDTKGSPAGFTNADVNNNVSHKPGLGIEGGIGLSYSYAKNLRLKAGIQYNSTSYGIEADKTSHPILTSVLLNDASTGYSYYHTRTTILANPYNTTALQPVTLHNTTHQVSVPIGIAYKLASVNKLEWFAGASIQPTYVFGGNAYLVSADMKNYVSEPSIMRSWNLNTGFETYINYKLAGFTLQVGPQARYQLLSTYKKRYTLVEKPYAVGVKIGIVKVF